MSVAHCSMSGAINRCVLILHCPRAINLAVIHGLYGHPRRKVLELLESPDICYPFSFHLHDYHCYFNENTEVCRTIIGKKNNLSLR